MPVTRAKRNESIVDLTKSSASDKNGGKHTKTKGTASKPPVICSEIIEISDDDDDEDSSVPAKRKSSMAELERQVKKLKQENDNFRRQEKKTKEELKVYQKDITQLRAASSAATSSKNTVPISELEDNVTCEICTLKMWTPYILPECGHSFCEECLKDWLSTTLMQHMTVHPNYNVNQGNQLPLYVNNLVPFAQFNPHMAPNLLQQFGGTPSPQYTCPTCRERVRNPPVENFALKAVVRAVAAVQGENSPRPKHIRQGKKKVVGNDHKWDGFFPRARI